MLRRLRALTDSLSTRLLLLLFATVALVLSAHSVVNYRSTRADILELVRASSDRASDLIRRSTHDGMLLNRLEEVQDTLVRIAQGPDVAALRVYDKHGRVVLSADPGEIGRTVELDSDTCLSCHGENEVSDVGRLEREEMIRSGAGAELLRHLSVIENEASCTAVGCHGTPEEQRVLGVLDVEMSTEPVENTLRAAQERVVWTTVALTLVIGAVSAIFIRRVVHRPVARLTEVTRQIASGDLESRVDVRGHDELSRLARSFNRMAQDLSVAQAQVTDWSQKLEQKVAEKTEQLQHAQRQVLHMEKMASLGKLSATVAHELNNPMNAMLTYARLIERELADQDLPSEVRAELERYVGVLKKECTRCGNIVRNLLLFARVDGAEMAATDLHEVLDRSLMLVRHHLEISQVDLQLEKMEDDSRIVGDSGQLQQALIAILVNSVEAMTHRDCDVRELGVRTFVDGQDAVIEVHDTGVGIDPDVLPQIFEPFFSTKNEESGTGLGLAVAYGIVQRHRGKIEVVSEPGQGTTFRLRLPREPRPTPVGATVGALS